MKQKTIRAGYWLTKAQVAYIRKVAFTRKQSQSELLRLVIQEWMIKK